MKTLILARLAGVLLAAVASTSAAQDARPLADRYTKTEYQVPMRDGKKLFTVVYEPRDTTRRYAVMMTRTPYSVGPYGATAYPRALGPSPKFADAGFIFVYQDVRGRFMSEGDFVHMTPWRGMAGAAATDESTDAYDTIDWLLSHVPRNTGRVGIWGVSYGGFFTAAALVNAHPALKAASPQAPQADWFMGDDVHHHGAFWLTSAFEFFTTSGRARATPAPTAERPARFDYGTDDGYAFFLAMGPLSNADKLYLKGAAPFWNDMMAHGTEDSFWQARKLAPTSQGRETGRAYRQRLVRREQPARRTARARGDRQAESVDIQSHRARPVVARPMGARHRRRTRRPQVRIEHQRLLSRQHRVSVLRVLPRWCRHDEATARHRVRDRNEPLAHVRRVATEGGHDPIVLSGRWRQALVLGTASRRRWLSLRPVRERSGSSGPVSRRQEHGHAPGLHGATTSASAPRIRTYWCTRAIRSTTT